MPNKQETSGNLFDLIARYVYRKGETMVGNEIGMGKSAISKILSNQNGIKLNKLGDLFSSIGLVVVDSNESGELITIPKKEYSALRDLALAHLQKEEVE